MNKIIELLANSSESVSKHIEKFWYRFLKETTFEFPQEVPDYHKQVIAVNIKQNKNVRKFLYSYIFFY